MKYYIGDILVKAKSNEEFVIESIQADRIVVAWGSNSTGYFEKPMLDSYVKEGTYTIKTTKRDILDEGLFTL